MNGSFLRLIVNIIYCKYDIEVLTHFYGAILVIVVPR